MDAGSLIEHAPHGGGLAALCDFAPCAFDAPGGLDADSFAPHAQPGACWPPQAGGAALPSHDGRAPHLAAAAGARLPPCVPLVPLAVVTPSPLAVMPPAASAPTAWRWPAQQQHLQQPQGSALAAAAAAPRPPRALSNAARELLFQEAEAIAGHLVLCEPGGSASAFGRAASPELTAYWPPGPAAHLPAAGALQGPRLSAPSMLAPQLAPPLQPHAGAHAAVATLFGNEASSSSSSASAEEAPAAAPTGPHAGFGGAASATALGAGVGLVPSPPVASRVRTPTKHGTAAASPGLSAPRADQQPRPRSGRRRPQAAPPAAGGAGVGLFRPSPGSNEAAAGAADCGAPQQGAPCPSAGRGAPKAPPKRRAPYSLKAARTPKRRPPIKLPARNPGRSLRCGNCGTAVTPQWRRGPDGPKTLCNSCGVRFQRGLPLWITDGQPQQQEQAQGEEQQRQPDCHHPQEQGPEQQQPEQSLLPPLPQSPSQQQQHPREPAAAAAPAAHAVAGQGAAIAAPAPPV